MAVHAPTRPDAVAKPRHRADLVAAALLLAFVATAVVVCVWFEPLRQFGAKSFRNAPALFGEWPLLGTLHAHVGPGTPVVLVVAVAVAAWGPALAARLSWPRLLLAGYATALVWTFGLALVDGWQVGVAARLRTADEYLHEVPGITDIPAMLRGFTGRILDYQPDSWTTHVSGHPPGATLVFVWLDRIGLGGGAWAGVACIVVGCLTAVAVPVTIKELGAARVARAAAPGTVNGFGWGGPARAAVPGTVDGRGGADLAQAAAQGSGRSGLTRAAEPDRVMEPGAEGFARAAVPFLALFPGAVWVGASADGLFAGVTTSGIALLALGAARRRVLPCLAGGLLLGYGIFLSYGLLLLGAVALAVVLVTRSWRALVLAAVAALAVFAVFSLAGFWWPDGYSLVVQRYYQGIGAIRPYSYWVWANLACLAVVVGPAVAPGLRRAFADRGRTSLPVVALAGAALVAVLAADVSGLSKAETERIWLPFAVWLVPLAALLPASSRRWWLLGQAAVAIAVNHILVTSW
ncbi:hypothetical protein [Labedaea rhizosphaerae]|uniref:Integral membrane protein n=1 Tax=Labedaea rhizosphaerae TaxID=598644 RepID=A0A4R6SMF1_LABRH|nr:hypothetical protein [Labedaea rhizosphaerae]TDQ04343.1 hypothetical protein EV186_101288 [Labedaea rhizosphaerae]